MLTNYWKKEGAQMQTEYEVVMGLEVHVELNTKSKIFCGCSTKFGKEPNTQVCPVCLGLPGTLPVLNKKVVEYAVIAGIATNCKISKLSKQDRKNYFYPDLPKAYQISQYDMPICEKGSVEIDLKGKTKTIGITRIHIEEDAGKLIHDEEHGSLVDYNRGGVPLIEVVSEPELSSWQEADAYLKKLRAIFLYTGISDCKMNEGSFRCDVNLSVRKKGSEKLGTRTEMKNLNSFTSIMKAIENETQRQIKLLESGRKVVQETRRWEQDKNKSISMRNKEDSHDYRYFPDPDLMPIVLNEDYIENIRKDIVELPDERKRKYIENFGLLSYDAEQIVSNKKLADFFEMTATRIKKPKIAANIIMTDIMRLLSKEGDEDGEIPFKSDDFVELINFIDEGVINNSIAKKVLEKMWTEKLLPGDIIQRDNLKLLTDEKVLNEIINEVLLQNKKSVDDYKAGKEKALQALIGQVMGETSGRAEPNVTKKIITEKLL